MYLCGKELHALVQLGGFEKKRKILEKLPTFYRLGGSFSRIFDMSKLIALTVICVISALLVEAQKREKVEL
ncbi:hypothetical protein OESDEN_11344, partial [Oesophagostomum dentatum]